MPLDSAPTLPSCPLSELGVGDAAIVRHVRGERRNVVRLLEMGLVPGTRIELRRRAPLGDPIELRVRGYALSIRGAEAAGIEVERT
jgi:ferrous iron transport protein A